MGMGSLFNTWSNCFELTLGNVEMYKTRLRELLTWNKPTVSKKDDKHGKWTEWAAKVSALKGLIEEQYPNTVYTLDNKVILRK